MKTIALIAGVLGLTSAASVASKSSNISYPYLFFKILSISRWCQTWLCYWDWARFWARLGRVERRSLVPRGSVCSRIQTEDWLRVQWWWRVHGAQCNRDVLWICWRGLLHRLYQGIWGTLWRMAWGTSLCPKRFPKAGSTELPELPGYLGWWVHGNIIPVVMFSWF